MIKKLSIVVIIATTFVVLSCSNTTAPQKLDYFVDKTELNCDKYDADDWQKSMVQYDQLVKEFNKPGKQYTEAEKQMAARAMGRYHSLLIKNGIEQSAAYIEELKQVLPSYLEGLVDGLGESSDEIGKSLEGIFNSEEFEKAFESLEEELEDIFGRIDEE